MDRIVIACRGMEPELDALASGARDVEVRFMDQNLHRTPDLMRDILQEEVGRAENETETIVLGYGLCSNGVRGVGSKKAVIHVPRVHDCISLFLGSREAYEKAFAERPGSYYLTPGWVREEKDPIGFMERDYVPRVGRETAEWAMHEELRHYTHVVLIDTGVGDYETLRKRAKMNAEVLKKTYQEVEGKDAFFKKILFGPYDNGDFVSVPPGEKITQGPFLK